MTGSPAEAASRSEAEHVELLDALLRTEATVVLSGYASDLYDTALVDWERRVVPTRTQGADRAEVVWTNGADESALFSLAELQDDETAMPQGAGRDGRGGPL